MITRELMLDILLEIDIDIAKEYATDDPESVVDLIERVEEVIESHRLLIMTHEYFDELMEQG